MQAACKKSNLVSLVSALQFWKMIVKVSQLVTLSSHLLLGKLHIHN
jgi:hypothetical protein